MTPTRDTPFRVRDQTPGPSPSPFIRYRGGLGVAPAEGELTLKKKKSWFGSVKDIFQKSALQAKAAVDSVRGEQVVTKGDEG